MKCPRCKNEGFVPSEEVAHPVRNIGGKEKFSTVDYRRYVCLQCGHRWITKEVFHKKIECKTEASDG